MFLAEMNSVGEKQMKLSSAQLDKELEIKKNVLWSKANSSCFRHLPYHHFRQFLFRYTEEGEYLSDHLHISGISQEEQHLLPSSVF